MSLGMQNARKIERIRRKYRALWPEMDERMRRQWAAAEARDLGWGGVTAAAQATGMSRTTITAGLAELKLPVEKRSLEATRVRRPGGGRRPLVRTDPELVTALGDCVGKVDRADDAGRPAIAFAVDLQEYASTRGGVDQAAASGQPAHRGGDPA
jgi:hypothetical protein